MKTVYTYFSCLLLASVLLSCSSKRDDFHVTPVYAPAVVADPEIQMLEKTFSDFSGIVPKYYSEDSTRLECLMFVENGSLKTRFFFDPLQRIEEVDHYDCSAMHGIQKRFYANGHTKESLEMDHGVRNGLHLAYYNNGKIKARETWKNGKRVSPIVAYDSTGNFSYVAPRNQYRSLFLSSR